MLKNTVVDRYNIDLINYDNIFTERVCDTVVNELYDLNLIIDDRVEFDKTLRAAVTHHVIDSVCTYILDSKTRVEQPVFVICPDCLDKTELNQYLADSISLGDYIVKQFDRLKTILGINSLITELGFDTYVELVKSADGDVIESLQSLNNNKPRDLHKLYSFVKKMGLRGIKQKFFDEQKYKQVFI